MVRFGISIRVSIKVIVAVKVNSESIMRVRVMFSFVVMIWL